MLDTISYNVLRRKADLIKYSLKTNRTKRSRRCTAYSWLLFKRKFNIPSEAIDVNLDDCGYDTDCEVDIDDTENVINILINTTQCLSSYVPVELSTLQLFTPISMKLNINIFVL